MDHIAITLKKAFVFIKFKVVATGNVPCDVKPKRPITANSKMHPDSAFMTTYPKENNNNKNTNSSNGNFQSEKATSTGSEHWKKNTVLIAGDSMLKNITEWTLSRRYTTKVCYFRGYVYGKSWKKSS